MTRKCTLRPESLAIVKQLQMHGRATETVLRAHLPEQNKTDLARRLSNLVAGGWLDFDWDDNSDRYWFVRPSARAAVATALPAPPVAPNIVPPPTHNVMSGHYRPREWQIRVGALDAFKLPSRTFCGQTYLRGH